MMASGMAGKSMASLVPRMTSWRLARNCRSRRQGTFETMTSSDFFLRDEEDMLCAVRPIWWWCLTISLLVPLAFPLPPFSMADASLFVIVEEAIAPAATHTVSLSKDLFRYGIRCCSYGRDEECRRRYECNK